MHQSQQQHSHDATAQLSDFSFCTSPAETYLSTVSRRSCA